MRAVLSGVEGTELRNRLMQIADETWRAAHPERATTLGGHGGDPLPFRLADALMKLVHGDAGSSTRPAVVVTIDAETLDADLAGTGPIPTTQAFALIERADLYAAIRNTRGSILKFGRSRRLASPMQSLAVIIRDRQCVYPGCDCAYDRCEVHHVVDTGCETRIRQGGETNIDNLALLCKAHHHHLHNNHQRLIRHGSGWAVIPEQEQTWQNTG